MSASYFLQVEGQNIEARPPSNIHLKPECLVANGIDLIVLDPGHDDSASSMRSEGKDSANGPVYFGRPKIHEGKLAMASAWMAYDLMLKDPSLSDTERRRLQTMIRFSRYPGETSFGQWEKSFGYYSSTQGTIDSGVGNRQSRVNYMMKNHRVYDASRSNYLSTSTRDVSSRTAFIAVHGNNTDEVYDAADLSWVIVPKNISATNASMVLARHLLDGLSEQFGSYFEVKPGDSSTQSSLKRSVASTVQPEKIRLGPHASDLAMLSSALGNSSTRKAYLEGFMMSGKAGHLANIDITENSSPQKLIFKRSGSTVASYDVSELYIAYGRAIVQAIHENFGCK